MTVPVIEKFPATEHPSAKVSFTQLATHPVPGVGDLESFKGPLGVFHLCYAAKKVDKEAKPEFDPAKLDGFPDAFVTDKAGVLAVAAASRFSAKLGDVVEFSTTRSDGTFLCEAVVGCGKRSEFKNNDAYTLSKAVAKSASAHRFKHVVFAFEKLEAHLAEAVVTGFLDRITVDKRFRKDPSPDYSLEGVHLVTSTVGAFESFVDRCKTLASGMHVARELVTAPPNYCNTLSVSSYVKEKYSALGLTVKVLGEEECRALGMGAYCAVAQGSYYPPRFLHATYKGDGPVKAKLALVGKGLMFDAGGYNIKNAACEIELMKFDMGGMATVFGAAEALCKLKPKGVEVHFLSATCENMVDSTAYRPGDVLTASNGKTIEVINTDAEGRLTLADALVYAEKLGVDYVVDLATLTGGCIVALGYQYGGYFANDEDLNARFVKALEASGELAWRLPLAKEYTEFLESKVADLTNCSYTVKASTISAALFLKEFVDSVKWVHWDIAGTAFEKAVGRGTGYGVRTLVNLVLDLAHHP